MEQSKFLEMKGFLSFFILHELSHKELCGDDLAKKIGARKGTVLTPGTIYPALKNLKKAKLIKLRKDGRKKYYELTDSGKQELNSLYEMFSKYFFGLKKKIARAKK
ncbi:MAG: PadR family transcriptional regulator [Candidatus Woesearchaeota archaeon]